MSRQAPLPPTRSAVAARVAARRSVVDELLDETVAQAPLPPEQSALAARLMAGDQIGLDAPPPVPLPAPRPTTASVPAPPPVKPVLPVSSSLDRGSASVML
jgi:hypothetical protein